MKKKYYRYVVSFFHSNGNGFVQILRRKKIKTFADLNELKKDIEYKNTIKKVVIINIMPFGTERR